MTQGLHEWLSMLASRTGDSLFLAAVRVCVMAVSLLFLTEFGRAGMASLRGKGPGRWIYGPLLALVTLGRLDGWAGLNHASRYMLGAGGGLWAALIVFTVLFYQWYAMDAAFGFGGESLHCNLPFPPIFY